MTFWSSSRLLISFALWPCAALFGASACGGGESGTPEGAAGAGAAFSAGFGGTSAGDDNQAGTSSTGAQPNLDTRLRARPLITDALSPYEAPWKIKGKIVALLETDAYDVWNVRTVDAGLQVVDQMDFQDFGRVELAGEGQPAILWQHDPTVEFGASLWLFDGTPEGTGMAQDGLDAPAEVFFGDGLGFTVVHHELDQFERRRVLKLHLDAPNAELIRFPSDLRSFRPSAVGGGHVFGTGITEQTGEWTLGTLTVSNISYNHILYWGGYNNDCLGGSVYIPGTNFAFLSCSLGRLYVTDGSTLATNLAYQSEECSPGRISAQGGRAYFIESCAGAVSKSTLYVLGATSATTQALHLAPAGEFVGVPTDAAPDGRGLFLASSPTAQGIAIWATDGSPETTQPFFEEYRILVKEIERVGDWIYFSAVDQRENRGRPGLFRVDMDGNWEEIELGVSVASGPGSLHALGDHLVFALFPTGENPQLWVVESAAD